MNLPSNSRIYLGILEFMLGILEFILGILEVLAFSDILEHIYY